MIDGDHLARQTAGDMDLQDELLALFLAQLTALRDRIAAAANGDGAVEELPSMLHRVRGAAHAVGAEDLARCLGAAEAALLRESAPRTVLDPLLAEVAAASAALSSLIAARKEPGLAKGGESR